jgi:phospholipid-binding lipoprotein MlaA
MKIIFTSTAATKARLSGAVLAALLLAGCAAQPPSAEIYDPSEALNRQFHAFNVDVDRQLLRPLATTTVKPGGGPISQGIVNFAANLSAPTTIMNNILQLRLGRAVENTLKFAINTTVGVGGLFNPAKAAGIEGSDSDFGETLHVWGFGEGAYLEAPLIGPTTSRDLSGLAVDIAINPLQIFLPPKEARLGTIAGAAAGVVYRGQYVETIDSVLYDSADSYGQARILYLQNRRFELGVGTGADDIIDPYEDPYAQ